MARLGDTGNSFPGAANALDPARFLLALRLGLSTRIAKRSTTAPLTRVTPLLAAVAAALLVSLASGRAELVVQTIYKFFPSVGPGSVPYNPIAEGSDSNFYGTRESLWSPFYTNCGAIFKVSRSGVFTPLLSFNGTNGSLPYGGLTAGKDGCLYGTTYAGGSNSTGFYLSGYGTIFKVTTNGELTSLFSFSTTNGCLPNAPLCAGSDGFFYGTTTTFGGSDKLGTVFRVSTNGEMTRLYAFSGADGGFPDGSGLVEGPDGSFYGTTPYGGTNFYATPTGLGTVYKITTNGVLTPLIRFNGTNGARPYGTLALGSDQNFYGTTTEGGAFGLGTIFKMTANGALTTLISFDGTNGARPLFGVAQGRGGNFYGTASQRLLGTNWTYGAIFKMTTNGVLTTLLYSDGTNSVNPMTTLISASDGNLYGALTDSYKNPALDGSIGSLIRLVEPPTITSISASNGAVTLTWTSFTNGTYQLQSKSSLAETNWLAIESDVTATGSITSLTASSGGNVQSYYRVVLLP